jgi:hypothetical protein
MGGHEIDRPDAVPLCPHRRIKASILDLYHWMWCIKFGKQQRETFLCTQYNSCWPFQTQVPAAKLPRTMVVLYLPKTCFYFFSVIRLLHSQTFGPNHEPLLRNWCLIAFGIVKTFGAAYIVQTSSPALGPVWHRLNGSVFRQLLKLALEAGIFAFGK